MTACGPNGNAHLSKRVMVVCRTGDSGLTDYSFSLIPHLARYAEVEFVTAEPALAHPARGSTSIVPMFRRMRHVVVDLAKFVVFALKRRPDVVLFQSWISWPLLDGLAVRVLRLGGIRVAMTVHDVMPHYPMPWSRLSVGFLFRAFHLLIAHSSASREALVEMGVRVPLLEVPHGEYAIFNTEHLDKATARKRLGGIGIDDFVLLFFGQLDERKGLLEYLAVARKMVGEGIVFVVAGKNELAAKNRYVLNGHGSAGVRIDAERVPFERVQEYFAASDVVAIPYREGTTSGVAKIAMAFGKPIIASRVGDLPETLRDWPGILINENDLESGLAEAVRRMKIDEERFASQAQSAREKYSWDRIGREYSQYLGLVAKTP